MIWSIDKPIKNKYIFFIFIYLQQGDACQTEEVDEENKSLIWTLVKQVNKCYILWRVNKYTTKGRDQFYWATTPLKSYKDRNICDITYKCNVLYSLDLSLKSFFHRKSQILRKYQNSEVLSIHVLYIFVHAQSMYCQQNLILYINYIGQFYI